VTPVDAGVAPACRDRVLEPLIGPGAAFEVEAVAVDGVALRDFVRTPRTIVDVFHTRQPMRRSSMSCTRASA